MTRLTPRLRWRQAIASDAFPRSERVVRGTLLCLVDLMSPTGDLTAWRDQMVKATGLPPRTLDRHLQRAVDAGWLVHEKRGGQGREGLYRALIPADSAPRVAHYSGDSAPTTRGLSPRSSAPLSGAVNKESANDSERVAVDRQRGRRRTHVGAGVSALDYLLNDSSNGGEWAATPSKRLSSVPRADVA